MGQRGPKPAPAKLKLLKGTDERYINRDAPLPSEGAVVCPDWLCDGAKEVWARLAPDLVDKECLTPWDVDTFAIVCNAIYVYRDCSAKMGDRYTDRGAAGGVIKSPFWQVMRDAAETIAKFSSRFGLTPGDRADLQIDTHRADGPKQGAERILG